VNNEDVCNVEQEKRLQEGVYTPHYKFFDFVVPNYFYNMCTRYPGTRVGFILIYICLPGTYLNTCIYL